MRFFFTLGLIVLVGFFAMRSCGEKLVGGGKHVKNDNPVSQPVQSVPVEPPSAAGTPPSSPAVPAAVAAPLAAPAPISFNYKFLNRPVPPASYFSALAGSGAGVGSVVVLVDQPSNSVSIRGPADVAGSLFELFSVLDVEAPEAFVDAWMLFVRGDKIKDFEAEFSFLEGGFDLRGTGSVSSDGFGVSLPLGPVKASLSALCSRGMVEVIDRPQLRLSSGKRSEVSTGDDVPFPVTTFRDGIASTSIEFKRVGLNFSVDPLFLANNRVRMDVKAENGLLGPVQKIAGVEIPSISRQSVDASATLSMDDALVIGGLESVRREKRFGLLGQSEKMQVGRLYVCIMLRSGYPKARPVIGPGQGLGIDVPGVEGDPGVFDDSLLPPKGWFERDPAALDREIKTVEDRISRIKGCPGK